MKIIRIEIEDATKVVVASDLHVGDPRVKDTSINVLRVALQLEKPDVLILSGDILEGGLANETQKQRLRLACTQARSVVVLKGNHDKTEVLDNFAKSVNAEYGDCVLGCGNGVTFATEHGDRFNSAWKKIPLIGHLGIWLNLALYRLTGFDIQKWFRSFKFVQKSLEAQHRKARDAWPDKTVVVTGHTHIPTGEPSGVGYFNSGDWLYHKTYVVIQNRRARLEHIP